MRKGQSGWMMAIILFGLGSYFCAQAEGALPISQLRITTPPLWQQHYPAQGQRAELRVEAPIMMPEVDTLPIITVRRTGPIVTPGANLAQNAEFGQILAAGPFPDADVVRGVAGTGQAPNNNMTPENAVAFISAVLDIYPEYRGARLRPSAILAQTPAYTLEKPKGKPHQIRMDLVQDPRGNYAAALSQELRGIPYLVGGGLYYTNAIRYETETPTVPALWGEITSPQEYQMRTSLIRETGILQQDTPIIPFSTAKALFETWIEAGKIHSVHRVALGYMAQNDPQALGQSFVLVPVWVLYGDISTSPGHKRPRDFWDEHPELQREVYRREMEYRVLAVDARHGLIIDWSDKKPDRLDYKP